MPTEHGRVVEESTPWAGGGPKKATKKDEWQYEHMTHQKKHLYLDVGYHLLRSSVGSFGEISPRIRPPLPRWNMRSYYPYLTCAHYFTHFAMRSPCVISSVGCVGGRCGMCQSGNVRASYRSQITGRPSITSSGVPSSVMPSCRYFRTPHMADSVRHPHCDSV